MPKYLQDIVQGGMSSKLTAEGWEFVITHYVEGFTNGTAAQRMYDAIMFTGHRIGESVGDFAPGAWLRSIECSPMGGQASDNDKFQIRCIYRENPRQNMQIDSGSTLNQVETNKAVDGSIMSVEYTYPDDHFDSNLAGKTVTQSGLVTIQKSERTVSFRVRESVDPAVPAAIYENKVNSVRWRGGEPYTWLCTGITGVSDLSGGYWDNVYTFQYKEETWDVDVIFKDNADGLPPADIENYPNAQKTYAVYAEADFNLLFSFPS